ncbi:MAG: hypothetical protein ACR2KO_17625 [Geodermatophilaceae bacterium]
MIQAEPLAATWMQREDRTARVRLTANPKYWDKVRGPHLQEIVFRTTCPRSRLGPGLYDGGPG